MNDKGSATVENVAWLPVLLLFLAAIIQFGLYFNARVAVQAAAYEAARQAAVSDNPIAKAESIAYDFANGTITGWSANDRVKVYVDSEHTLRPGNTIQVRVTYKVPAFFVSLLPSSEGPNNWLEVAGSSSTTIEERP